MRISDWSSDVCSSDLVVAAGAAQSTADDAVQLALGNDGRAFCSRGAGENSVRCGANTKEDVTAANGIGIGTDAQALADGGIAVGHNATAVTANPVAIGPGAVARSRSEERRVGKGFVSTCSFRWCQEHSKKTR